MAFQSGVTVPGSSSHTVLTWVVALVLVACVVLFNAMLAREVYRSLRFAQRVGAIAGKASGTKGYVPGSSPDTIAAASSPEGSSSGSGDGSAATRVSEQHQPGWSRRGTKAAFRRGWPLPSQLWVSNPIRHGRDSSGRDSNAGASAQINTPSASPAVLPPPPPPPSGPSPRPGPAGNLSARVLLMARAPRPPAPSQ